VRCAVRGRIVTQPGSFVRDYEALLAQLADMPAFLERSLSGLPPARLRETPPHDELSLLEHLWHVRDCDSDLYGLRIRRALGEDRPSLEPVDVGAWPAERSYLARTAESGLAEFAQLRARLLGELAQLDERALARTGRRADGSEVSVLDIVIQLVEHDRDHRQRVAAILCDIARTADGAA
jgi:hypothetical protein